MSTLAQQRTNAGWLVVEDSLLPSALVYDASMQKLLTTHVYCTIDPIERPELHPGLTCDIIILNRTSGVSTPLSGGGF